MDGECKNCPKYTRINSSKNGCVTPRCGPREIFTEDGKCQACEPFTRPIDYGLACGNTCTTG